MGFNMWILYLTLAGMLVVAIGLVVTPWITPQAEIKWRMPLVYFVVFIFLACFLYFVLGDYRGLQQHYLLRDHDKITQALIKELKTPAQVVLKMKQQLAKTPNSIEGWFLLGRLYVSMQQYPEAADSFAHAYALNKLDSNIAVQYAEALFFANHKKMTPEIKQLLDFVMQKDPNNEAAINLLALNAYQEQHYQQAIHYWEQLLPQHAPNSEDGQALLKAIRDAEQKINPKS